MKERRSNKSFNSRLTRWIDKLLPFDFYIEHTLDTKMGMVDQISCQPNHQAKVTNKYGQKIADAKISLIRDAIVAFFTNSSPAMNCAQLDARWRLNSEKDNSISRCTFQPKLANTIPRTKKTLESNDVSDQWTC